MEVAVPHLEVAVDEPSGISDARRRATRIAEAAGLDAVQVGRVALLTTELGTNLLKHAHHGCLLMRPLLGSEGGGVELLSVDRGPGMRNISESLRDGCSTAGSRGSGLGAVMRQSDVFDLWSEPGAGAIVLSRVHATPPTRAALWFGAVGRAHPRETECGDAWGVKVSSERDNELTLAVVDGLGHGALAATAAAEVMGAFGETSSSVPEAWLRAAHYRSRATRGAAASVASFSAGPETVSFAGVGNVSGRIVGTERTRGLVSHHGTLGRGEPRIRAESHGWDDEIVVLASDGLSTRWAASSLPAWGRHHPATLAAFLWRDHSRGVDDVTVAVCARRHA